jgi:hypothetical protein
MDAFEALRKRIGAPCWVPEGWQRIVVDAVERIEWLLARDPVARINWEEIKVWHGTLAMRFRFSAGGDETVRALIADVVEAAKVRAERTCMVCGGAGRMIEGEEDLRVRCTRHQDDKVTALKELDADAIAKTIDDDIERLELPWSVAGVVRTTRPGEWCVAISWGQKKWTETWVENPNVDEVEQVLDIGATRIGKVRVER